MTVGLDLLFNIRARLTENIYPDIQETFVEGNTTYYSYPNAEKKETLKTKIFYAELAIDIIACVGCLVMGSLLTTHVLNFHASPWYFFGPAIGIPSLVIVALLKACAVQKCCL